MNRKFGAAGHGHSDAHDSHSHHGHGQESPDYHTRKFNRVSYNKVLNNEERDRY